MKTNVIAFNRAKTTVTRSTVAKRPANGAPASNVVSLDEWKSSPRTRRTASGVFFTTGVLATLGSVA